MSNPGSKGEHQLQEQFGTTRPAQAFYNKQMLDHLNTSMREFVIAREMVFISTADSKGECDCSFRAGSPGFVQIVDEKTLAYPEYKGNGVLSSLGNIEENPHIGMIFIDFMESTIGLHVNGKARIVINETVLSNEDLPVSLKSAAEAKGGKKPVCWVWIDIEEAYVHCSKHIPNFEKVEKGIHWGTDKAVHKGGDFFKAEPCDRPWKK